MRRFLALILAIISLFSLSLFTACISGGNGGNGGNGGEGEEGCGHQITNRATYTEIDGEVYKEYY